MNRKTMMISLCLILLITLAGIAAWAISSDSGPVEVFLSAPAAGLFLWSFFAFIRHAHPGRPVRGEAAMFHAPVLLAALIQVYMIAQAFHLDWSGPRLGGVAIGLVWAMIGNAMGKLNPGHPFGLRTPWTLADPHIWDQTNRFGGRAMVLAGLAAIFLTFTLPPGWPLLMALASLPMAVLAAITLKSWRLWRQRHPGESALSRPGALWPLAIGGATAIAIFLDLAIEQGRSAGVIAAGFLLSVVVARYRQARSQRRQ